MSPSGHADYRSLFESLPGLFLVVEPNAPRFTIVAVSDEYARSLRTTREELVGRALPEVFNDTATAGRDLAASLEKVVRTCATDTMPVQRRGDRWWSHVNAPVVGTDGALTHIIHRADDVTELRSATDEIGSLVEYAPDGVLIADLSGRYVSVNAAACRMFGYAREELVGMNIRGLLEPHDFERLQESREKMLAGEAQVDEWVVRRKDGSHLSVEVSANILADGRWQAIVRDISARKRLEIALRELNSDLNRAQSVAKIGSWRLDVRRNELTWSDENYRIFGIALGTPMTYEAFLACAHPDDRAFVDREWNAALRGAPYDIEHRLLVAGETRWVREKADLKLDEHGQLLGGIGITQDITERRRLVEELRLAEAQSSGIVALSADAIVSIDENERITMFNEGAEKIFGYSKAEILGAPLDTLIPERFRAVHRQRVAGFATGPVASRRMGARGAEILGLRKNGEEFPADAAISRLEIGGTRILTVALRDITEQQRTQREQSLLAEIGAAFASTLDYEETLANVARLTVRDLADLCIVDVVEDDVVRRLKVVSRDPANASLCALLEKSPPERSLAQLVEQVLRTGQSVLREHLSPDLPLSHDERHLLRALDPRSMVLVPLVAHGNRLGVMKFLSTTPTRLYRPRDLRLLEDVAHRAALAIDNARLYRAARQAVQARDDVLGIVAHDLRNPLSSILMQAALLLRGHGDPDAIQRAAARMNHLIQDLLDVTSMEAGHVAIEACETPTMRVLNDALESQRPPASDASLTLDLNAADGLPPIWGDRNRLLQVFENLIGNAIKFSRPGGTISLGAKPREDDVLFWVGDTGVGIDPEALPHVFERFWQARGERRRGAGLGLAIVKGIVEGHGGKVWAESEPKHGSTFFFTIPTTRRTRAEGPSAML